MVLIFNNSTLVLSAGPLRSASIDIHSHDWRLQVVGDVGGWGARGGSKEARVTLKHTVQGQTSPALQVRGSYSICQKYFENSQHQFFCANCLCDWWCRWKPGEDLLSHSWGVLWLWTLNSAPHWHSSSRDTTCLIGTANTHTYRKPHQSRCFIVYNQNTSLTCRKFNTRT